MATGQRQILIALLLHLLLLHYQPSGTQLKSAAALNRLAKSQFRELEVCLSVVSKESILIRSIFVHKWAEGRVSQESLVGRQLKKAFLLPRKELSEVRIVEDQWIGGPGSLKAGPLLVASSQGVSTRKSNNVLVTQAHLSGKHLPEVVRA